MRIALVLSVFLWGSVACGQDDRELLLVLADRSDSTRSWDPPEQTLAVLRHVVNVASLTDRQIDVAVITFGNTVQVFGDEQGRPTAAFDTLLARLEKNWPEAGGGTPLDSAFEKAVQLYRQAQCRTTIILLTDGQPASGFLQPDRFSEVRQKIDTMRELVVNRYVEDGMTFLTRKLKSFDDDLENPESDLFQKLYLTQQKAEVQLVLKLAKQLNQSNVRFITFDHSGIEILEEIHSTAGGRVEDFVRTEPGNLLPSLNEVFTLPGVVQAQPIQLEADDSVCESELQIKTDPIAQSIYTAIEFRPAITDFAAHCELSIETAGGILQFDPFNSTAETSLGRNGVGSVVTANMRLSFIPDGEELTVRWLSPNGTMTSPAATAYTYLKLRDDVVADFRPVHLPMDHRPPFDVAAEQLFAYSFALRTRDNKEQFPIESAEAVLRSRSTVIRLPMSASQKHPGTVVSEDKSLPPGTWDVEVNVRTESGLDLRLSLPQHLTTSLRDRKILMRLPLGASDETQVSDSQSHLNFGLLNDAQTTRTLEFLVSPDGFDLPVEVEFTASFVDAEGNNPSQSWVSFRKQKMTLRPGKTETQQVTIALPDEVDGSIIDGLLSGGIEVRLSDSGMRLPIERSEVIADGNDIPPEQITFELKRPTLTVELPWAGRNRIEETRYGEQAILNIDINTGFTREVEFVVFDNGNVEKQLRLLPGSSVVDKNGAVVGTLRLGSTAQSEVMQTLAPGEQVTWTLRLEVDPDHVVEEASTHIDIAGDGIAHRRIPIRIFQRQPLLNGLVEWTVWSLLGGLVLYLIRMLARRRQLNRLTTDAEPVLTERRGLSGILSLETLGPGVVALVPDVPMERLSESGSVFRNFQPGQPIRLQQNTEDDAVLIRVPQVDVPRDDDDPLTFEVVTIDANDDRPEVEIAILDGGHFDDQNRRCTRRLSAAFVLAMLLVGLGLRLDEPSVITSLQWYHDALIR
ncbi:MAG: vWA domain-containing protein [Fuerstiella sp.]